VTKLYCPNCGGEVRQVVPGSDFECYDCNTAWAPTLGHLLFDEPPSRDDLARHAAFYDTDEAGMD
jgi:hypothetical protein